MTEIERIIAEAPMKWVNEGSKLKGQEYLAKAIEQYVIKALDEQREQLESHYSKRIAFWHNEVIKARIERIAELKKEKK